MEGLLHLVLFYHFLCYNRSSMKKRRIFIAINLPSEVKRKLLSYQRQWQDLPVRWIKPDNLHITLVFIGYINDEELLEICKATHQVAERHKAFNINLERVLLGPPNRPPRMIWAEGEISKELARLRNDLEKTLLDSAGSGYNRREPRAFRPHITLARIKQREWKKLAPKPEIKQALAASILVGSIEVMESQLKKTGAEYSILESIKLL